MKNKKVNAIIFDLGGVIINLDMERSYQALMSLSKLRSDPHALLKKHMQFFFDYEKGLIDDNEFREGLRIHFGIQGSDQEINEAWNKMLLDVPPDRIELIKELGNKYRLFVLSNTCQIHVDSFEKELSEANGVKDMKDLFERIYYSHRTGFRKPQPQIFKMVLEENNLDPAQTLFIDDNLKNVESAKKLGILTAQMEQNGKLGDYFLDY